MTAIVGDSGSTSTQYTDSSVAAETAYVYAVQALSPDGNGARSETTTVTTTAAPPPTVPPTPVPATNEVTSLMLASDTAGQLVITWNQPSDEPNDYRVVWAPADEDYLSYSADNTTRRGNSYPAGGTTTLTLTGLPGGTTYKVMMRARYHDAENDVYSSGPWTSDTTQRVRNNPPAAPTDLSLTEIKGKDQTSINLAWTAPSHQGLTGYRIWRGATANSLNELVQDTNNTTASYSDATTENDNTYVYAVTALSMDGNSPRSTTMSITRAAAGISQRDAPPEEEEELIAQQQQSSDGVILTSTYTGDYNPGTESRRLTEAVKATRFTTGSNEHGYVLTKVTHALRLEAAGTGIVGAVVNSDNGGTPGDLIYVFPDDQTFTSTTAQAVTHVGEFLLEPNRKYWMLINSRSGTDDIIHIHYTRSGDVGTSQPGWIVPTTSSYATGDGYATFGTPYAIRLEGVVLPPTDEPDHLDFPMDASTSGRLRIGTTSTGTLDAVDDNVGAYAVKVPRGDLFKIEGLEHGHSYRVRAWFGTSKEDSATAARGGAIGLQAGQKGSDDISSFSPHNDNLLDDGRASFVFPAFASEDYYVDLVAPAFQPPNGITPAHTYYGPYMLEIYDLGVTQRQLSIDGQTCTDGVCTGGTITYSEGYGIKASNICINNRCFNDPRFPEFHRDGYETVATDIHEVSVGHNPSSKNLWQGVIFQAHDTTSPTAKFQLDRIGAFVHSMSEGSIAQAAIYTAPNTSPAIKLFDLEPIYNDDRHIEYFVVPHDAPALTKGTNYAVVFSEGGGSTDSYKLYATGNTNDDDNRHPKWPVQAGGRTLDSLVTMITWDRMRSGDTTTGVHVTAQIRIYAGVAE